MRKEASVLIAIATALIIQPVAAQHQHHGKVSFEISCNEDAQAHFNQGVALLHHMMYEQAEPHFQAVAEADPSCMMAYWGLAMTQFHPLWHPSSPAELTRGREYIEQARRLTAPTEREAAYLAAVDAYFLPAEATFAERLKAWEAGMRAVAEVAPDDEDALAFHSLSRLATAPRDDKTFSTHADAGALLQELHRKHPEHPGLFHYTIHAYDNPVLASQALEVARGYDKLAPEVPHALHMPSHIFVRLGLWEDVIAWNRRSADAALAQPVGEMVSMHYPHAMDYLIYAHLQLGNEDEALAALEELTKAPEIQQNFGAAYGLAAAQARYALERNDWAAAAALETGVPAYFRWDDHPGAAAITHFARGLGAARSGNAKSAAAEAAILDGLHERLIAMNDPYWATQVDAQRKTVRAWQMFAENRPDDALALMREAADIEDSVDKHPVTPSAVRPARELLGDMYLALERPDEAGAAYADALHVSPGRKNSVMSNGNGQR